MHETEATITTSRRRSSDDVAAWRSRSMSSLTDGVLLDVRVGRGQVRLGLVVVVVRDEVLDGVVGEELAELVAELRGERLVVRDHERRPLDRPITLAIVNVLPVAVAPSSVWYAVPSSTPAASSAIACG